MESVYADGSGGNDTELVFFKDRNFARDVFALRGDTEATSLAVKAVESKV